MKRFTICLFIAAVISSSSVAQDVVSLGVNPDTGLEEIRVNIAGLPATAKPLDMVLIPAGTFMMGSDPFGDDPEKEDDELPQHQVTITNDIYVGKYEITQAQWYTVMGTAPSQFSRKPNNPVECVSWYDCQRFLQELNSILSISQTFRLPTEAEWEYVCRAGTTSRFHWGEDLNETKINDYAWYKSNSGYITHEVGLKLPNAWGLYDVSGNVWEWCQDWYGPWEDYDPLWDPVDVDAEGGFDKVCRGGSYDGSFEELSLWARSADWPGEGNSRTGFRLARSWD